MSHPATARLFIALDSPRAVCEELAAWARAAVRQAVANGGEQAAPSRRRGRTQGGRPNLLHGMRPIAPETMHITVCFLGSRPVEEIQMLSALVESCAQPPMGQASIGAPLWLPPRHPRALAVEVHDDSGTLAQLHRIVSADLSAAGLASAAPTHGAGHRAFRPHVTVARLRQGTAPRERGLEPTPQLSFLPQRLVLYRSWLSPEGASYEALASSPMTPAPVGD